MNIFEFLYYLGYEVHKMYGTKKQKRLPFKLASIGNLTVGGTGKTPATIAVAQEARRRGFSPVILTRGYKGSARGPCFVSTGDGALLGIEEAGDEPVVMAEKLQGVPIVKGDNRYDAGVFAIQQLASEMFDVRSDILFILDDGFQHWRLYRDKDIVLVDADNPFGDRRLLPSGRLREPLDSLARADVIVITKCDHTGYDQDTRIDSITREIRVYNSRSPVFLSAHTPVSCRLFSGDKRPLSGIADRKIFGFCALGNPESFKKTILSTGAEVCGFREFSDHHIYRQSDIQNVEELAHRAGAEWIATTEKDIIKMRNLGVPDNLLIIEIAFTPDAGFYDDIFSFS